MRCRLGLRKAAGLAEGFGEGDRAGHCDVERTGAGRHWDRDAGIGCLVHKIGDAGAFAAEQQRVGRCERKALQRHRAARRQQDEAGAGGARREKRRPRIVAAYCRPRGIIERRALQPAVVEDKTGRLDQVDGDGETGAEAEQRAGILRDVGLEQGEAQMIGPAKA